VIAVAPNPHDPSPLSRQLRLSDRDIAERLVLVDFVQEDADVLAPMRPWVARIADEFLALLYDEQFARWEFRLIVERARSSRERLVDLQRRYLLDLFGGMPDAAYVESRLRIGALHARIGVTPRWFVGTYRLYEKHLFPMITRHFWLRPGKARRTVAALSKLLNFDQALVLDMYIEGVTDDLRSQVVGREFESTTQASRLAMIMRRRSPPPPPPPPLPPGHGDSSGGGAAG
jgi:hypothetical protein